MALYALSLRDVDVGMFVHTIKIVDEGRWVGIPIIKVLQVTVSSLLDITKTWYDCYGYTILK